MWHWKCDKFRGSLRRLRKALCVKNEISWLIIPDVSEVAWDNLCRDVLLLSLGTINYGWKSSHDDFLVNRSVKMHLPSPPRLGYMNLCGVEVERELLPDYRTYFYGTDFWNFISHFCALDSHYSYDSKFHLFLLDAPGDFALWQHMEMCVDCVFMHRCSILLLQS